MSVLSWHLLLAIAFGIALAWVIFEAQQPESAWIHQRWKALTQLWQTASGKSIISGSIGTGTLLLGLGLTEATGRGWIAATLILQSLTSLGVFAIWQQSRGKSVPISTAKAELNCDRYIQDLAHPTLMRRLIAVKRLQHWIKTRAIAPDERQEIHGYFQVLLAQETDPMIRLALQESLDHRDHPILSGSTAHEFSVQVRDVPQPGRTASLSGVN